MSFDFKMLANNYISNLTPYQPGKPIEELERELGITSSIKLASNENALGASPKALLAAQLQLTKAHIYPDGGCFSLKKTLAHFLKVDTNQLTIGNGSENILEIIIKSYLCNNDAAVVSEYAFITIPLLVKSRGAELIKVPALHYGHDIPAMIQAVTEKTRIVFIVNPNNPTGTHISHGQLKLLLDSISPRILVVLDEAYSEYISLSDYPDSLNLLKLYPNLLITRTFSKIYGLAGLRLGYAISSHEIADILNRARLPFNVNSIAIAAGEAAILDQTHVKQTIAMNNEGMAQIIAGFKQFDVDYIPSIGNFISFDVKTNAADIYQKLLHQGVIVRPLAPYGLFSHLRVTIGTSEQNERFLKALQIVLGK